jgi:hypothetical protein
MLYVFYYRLVAIKTLYFRRGEIHNFLNSGYKLRLIDKLLIYNELLFLLDVGPNFFLNLHYL